MILNGLVDLELRLSKLEKRINALEAEARESGIINLPGRGDLSARLSERSNYE